MAHRLRFALSILVLFVTSAMVQNTWISSGSSLYAQEDGAAPAAAPSPAPAPAPVADGEEGGGHGQQTMLMWIIETSGWIGLIILGLSIYFVASVTRAYLEIRRSTVLPEEIVEECEKLVQARDFNALYKTVSEDDSFFSKVLASGIAELRHGMGEARESMDRVAEMHVADMERKISMIAVLGTLGPMIGLLGTLKGMISSFSVIAISDVQMRPSEVAGGISEALLLTFEGVGLSIPAIFFFTLLRNRIISLTDEASMTADAILRRVFDAARSRPAASSEAASGSV